MNLQLQTPAYVTRFKDVEAQHAYRYAGQSDTADEALRKLAISVGYKGDTVIAKAGRSLPAYQHYRRAVQSLATAARCIA